MKVRRLLAIAVFSLAASGATLAGAGLYRDLDGAERVGIVHGDIKPENVLVAPGDSVAPKRFGDGAIGLLPLALAPPHLAVAGQDVPELADGVVGDRPGDLPGGQPEVGH